MPDTFTRSEQHVLKAIGFFVVLVAVLFGGALVMWALETFVWDWAPFVLLLIVGGWYAWDKTR
jgi:hypothetical protein